MLEFLIGFTYVLVLCCAGGVAAVVCLAIMFWAQDGFSKAFREAELTFRTWRDWGRDDGR